MSAADRLPSPVSRSAPRVEVRPGGAGFITAIAGQEATVEVHRPLRPGSEVSLTLATDECPREFRGRVATCEVTALGGEHGITYQALIVLTTADGDEWAGIAHMGTCCP